MTTVAKVEIGSGRLLDQLPKAVLVNIVAFGLFESVQPFGQWEFYATDDGDELILIECLDMGARYVWLKLDDEWFSLFVDTDEDDPNKIVGVDQNGLTSGAVFVLGGAREEAFTNFLWGMYSGLLMNIGQSYGGEIEAYLDTIAREIERIFVGERATV